ncbi:hypothetical protein PYCCODRAFT_1438154 [Trametes coccinea BRFM310]|uniref:DUF6534 domain-containing protein n=1 Tax=Trametes coccinea (strain BRFM310) TaxID=1353009 RepID=A0A1Y2IER5_TRAC3|nr:hypothetical protein PYCCODRAFT_1438154 [Trametes coccinea BRFM310]
MVALNSSEPQATAALNSSWQPTGSNGAGGATLDNTIGYMLIGTFVSLVLYGVSVLQVYRYIQLYPKDSIIIKTIVFIVMILETVHSILPMHTCYYYLVSHFGSEMAALDTVWSINLLPVIASVTTLASQLFFARRVSLIGTFHKLVAVIAILSLMASVALSIPVSIEAFKLKETAAFVQKEHQMVSATLALAALADYMLSGAIICALLRSKDMYTRTCTTKFEYFTLYVINTGLLTGIIHGISAVFAIRWPSDLLWSSIGLLAIKLYAITLLAVLNSRKLLISRGVAIFETTEPLGRNIIARANHLAAVERWNAPRVPDETPTKLNIMVAAEIEVDGQIEGGDCTGSTSKVYGQAEDSLHSSNGLQ